VQYALGHRSFPTKGAAGNYLRAMLATGEIPDGEFSVLVALLEKHPEASDKIGSGVARFEVRGAVFGSRCFYVIRTDGTETDFSYRSCLNGKRATPWREYLEACRTAVEDDMRQAKARHFARYGDAVRCEETGNQVTSEEADVDHAPPITFEVIARFYARELGLKIDRNLVTAPADGQFQVRFRSAEIAEGFRAFHRRHAHLRILIASRNRANSSKYRIKTIRLPVEIGEA
jgi:hypothetical protein